MVKKGTNHPAAGSKDNTRQMERKGTVMILGNLNGLKVRIALHLQAFCLPDLFCCFTILKHATKKMLLDVPQIVDRLDIL